MIFCDTPLDNEPGMALVLNPGDPNPGKSYTTGVRPLTAKYAILDWATNPHALWKGEVESHMKKNGDKILRTVEA